jgi:hypothetical protein
MLDNKKTRLAWAYAELNDLVQRSAFGNIMFNMKDGIIINVKIEETRKPIVDNDEHLT